MATVIAPNTFLQRLVGAAALDNAIYEEVEADTRATWQAFLVVVVSSIAAGVGLRPPTIYGIGSVLFFTVLALVTWMAWALVTFEIGTRQLPVRATRTDVGELLRTLGFAATPGVLFFFGVLPGATLPVFVVTSLWMLVAMVVAVRQALDFTSTGRAVAVCVLGLVLSLAMAAVIGVLFAPSVG